MSKLTIPKKKKSKKNFTLLEKMIPLFKKFVSDLELPQHIFDSLEISRNNKEMEIFALSLPDLLYPDTYILAGRIYIYLHTMTAPRTVGDYIDILDGRDLQPEIRKFFQENQKVLDALLEETFYYNFRDHTILSASKCVDYLLRVSRSDPPVETPCLLMLRQAVQFYYEEGIDDVKKCYWELIEQEYVHASPTMFNAGTRKNQMSSCFDQNTDVITVNRGPVKIKDVMIGDIVPTHKGNFKKVVQLHQNPLEDRVMHMIKISKTPVFKVTGNHRFWTIKNGKKEPAWVETSEITSKDFICIPRKTKGSNVFPIDLTKNVSGKYKFRESGNLIDWSRTWTCIDHLNGTENMITRTRKITGTRKSWEADKDWAFFVGAWYGDGNIMTQKRKGVTTFKGIRLVVHESNKKLMKKYIEIGEEKMGVNSCVNKGTTYNKNLYYIDFHSSIIGEYFEKHYGKGFDGKKLDKNMFSWGYNEVRSFVCGLFSTDGCFAKDGNQTITMSNPKFLKDVYSLLRINGIDASYNIKEKEKVKMASCDIATINIPRTYLIKSEICKYYSDKRLSMKFEKNTRIKEVDGHVFLKVMSNDKIEDRPEFVYTIGVEDDHSYCVEGVMAENCFLLSIGDNLEDLLYTGAGDVAMISRLQGGIGMSLNKVRHSSISNTGKSSGVLPFARIYDSTIRCVDQGGKRNGAATISLNDWHIDAEDFICARDNYSQDGIRLKQANTALFVSSLFMRRVRQDKEWTLFCPAKAILEGVHLTEVRGDRFDELYHKLEEEIPRRKKEFIEINTQIEEIEREINSGKTNSNLLKKLNILTRHRVKVRKNLIDYKVVNARKMYNLICNMQMKSSFPYIVYADTINLKNNTMNIGLTQSSNLCVAPETKILTDNGHLMIGDLEDKVVNIWNGKQFSEVIVKKTGENQKLIKIMLDDGSVLECTPYHKFYIQDGYVTKTVNDILKSGKVSKVEAKDLVKGMTLVKCVHPIIDSGPSLKNAYTNGFFSGDGTCLKYEKRWDAKDIEKKFFVPVNYDLRSKLEWLAGFSDADGCVLLNENNQSIQLTSIHEEFMKNIKLMLQTCGCNPNISVCSEEGETLLLDGKGGKKMFKTKKQYRMVINSFETQILIENGLETHRLKLVKEHVQRKASQFIKVSSVEETGRISDTYCFEEPLRNAGIFNGIFTSQCLEISLPATPTEIASCNLGHVNLKKFLKEDDEGNLRYDYIHLGRATQALVRNIDKVIEYNYYPLDERDKKGKVTKAGKIHRPNIENRPLGIGVSGLAEVFALLGIPYDSDEAVMINKKIFAVMYFNGLYQSMLLAKKNGAYATFRTGESRIFSKDEGGWTTYDGSPLANGYFQFDLWNAEAEYLDSIGELNEKIYRRADDTPINPTEWGNDIPLNTWDELRGEILKYGVRNSMILALMPTASSAQMLRNAETTEAHQTLLYSRKLAHGNYIAFSEPFVRDMKKLKIWNKKMIDFINVSNGSIDGIHFFVTENPEFFPELCWIGVNQSDGTKKLRLDSETLRTIMDLRKIHKGMYEISQKVTARMARQRGIYVDQSQSFNCYLPDPNEDILKAFHQYTDALRLKTGMYYLRANPASQTGKFTVDLDVQKYHSGLAKTRKKFVCAEDECIMCQ